MKPQFMIQQSFRLVTIFSILFLNSQLFAQITTSSVSGQVKDKSGVEIPGASVIATHIPTGSRYGVATSFDGHYTIANMNPGGPYKIVVTSVGFKPQVREDIMLNLGSTSSFNFIVNEDATNLAEIVVKADKDGIKLGAGTSIG